MRIGNVRIHAVEGVCACVVPGDVLATAAMTTSGVGTPPPPRPPSSSSSSDIGRAVVDVMDAVYHDQPHPPRHTPPGDDADRDRGPSSPIDRPRDHQYRDAS